MKPGIQARDLVVSMRVRRGIVRVKEEVALAEQTEVLSTFDANAVEEALRIREKSGCKVIALTLGAQAAL